MIKSTTASTTTTAVTTTTTTTTITIFTILVLYYALSCSIILYNKQKQSRITQPQNQS